MKVLLCEDIEKLGYVGDVIEVKAGYARNYLIPQGLAEVPTEANIKAISKEKAKRAEQRMLARERIEKCAASFKGAEVIICAKTNEQGVLFGSVSQHDIAANLCEQGFDVTDKMVQLTEHIKQIGVYDVELEFSSDITVTIKVVVAPDEPREPQKEKDIEDTDKDSQV